MLRGPDYAEEVTAPADNDYPGQRLGLPREGRGSIARPGRRIAALLVDVACAGLIGFAFFSSPDPVTGVPFANPVATNLIFFLVQIVFIPLIGEAPVTGSSGCGWNWHPGDGWGSGARSCARCCWGS